MCNGHADEHQNCLAQVKKDVDDADATSLGICAYGAHNGGCNAVAEINTDNNRVDCLKCKHAGSGKRLQNTHGDR